MSASAEAAPPDASARGGVIWISGYSGAGKTTVARLVAGALHQRGRTALLLDGDDLRRVFAAKWSYQRDDRVELAKVYFRLGAYLASQGSTVVLAAVAMYDEVRDWIRTTTPGVFEVYLDVPEQERQRRDRLTKNVYPSIGDELRRYDPPTRPDLTVPNHGAIAPAQAADEVVNGYIAAAADPRALSGRSSHWDRFYEAGFGVSSPSGFAESVAAHELPPAASVLEVGCGNGRDAFFFARLGHRVTAIDASGAAIAVCQAADPSESVRFIAGDLPAVAARGELGQNFDVVYVRFVLHAMTAAEQNETLEAAHGLLAEGGKLLIECRSINDPLAREGEVISPTERVSGHYRRFIVADELVREVQETGFEVDHCKEATGLAPFDGEDPAVIRLVARHVSVE